MLPSSIVNLLVPTALSCDFSIDIQIATVLFPMIVVSVCQWFIDIIFHFHETSDAT